MHNAMLKWTEASETPQPPISVLSQWSISDEKVHTVEMQFWLWVKVQSIPTHSSMEWLSPLLMTKLVYMLRSGRLQYAAFRIPNKTRQEHDRKKRQARPCLRYCLLWSLHKFSEVRFVLRLWIKRTVHWRRKFKKKKKKRIHQHLSSQKRERTHLLKDQHQSCDSPKLDWVINTMNNQISVF